MALSKNPEVFTL